MQDLVGIPVSSAALFFISGLIFGTCLYRRSKATTIQDLASSRQLERLKFAWKRRKTQYLELQNHDSVMQKMRIESEIMKTENDSLRKKCESLESSLNQLEYDYLEQKEKLNRQVRRNRMLNTKLSEVIEAKTKLSALHRSGDADLDSQTDTLNPFQLSDRGRLSKNIATRPLLISDRVKLRIPRKAREDS